MRERIIKIGTRLTCQ
jgi:hypothetical protein